MSCQVLNVAWRALAVTIREPSAGTSGVLGKIGGQTRRQTRQGHTPAVQARARRLSRVSKRHLNGAPAILESPSQRGRAETDVDDGKILALTSEGMSTRMIAAKLGVSQPTVIRRLRGLPGLLLHDVVQKQTEVP